MSSTVNNTDRYENNRLFTGGNNPLDYSSYNRFLTIPQTLTYIFFRTRDSKEGQKKADSPQRKTDVKIYQIKCLIISIKRYYNVE